MLSMQLQRSWPTLLWYAVVLLGCELVHATAYVVQPTMLVAELLSSSLIVCEVV